MAFDYTLMHLGKKMYHEAEADRIRLEKEKFVTVPVNTAGPRKVRTQRPATMERDERKFLYGAFNPSKGISECCSMIRAANGACTGCGEES